MDFEKTLIIIKHDGVARGIMGKIISRFENAGLKLVGLEFIQSTDDLGQAHYPDSTDWLETVGNRTLTDYEERGRDAKEEFGTNDPVEIGKAVKGWLVEYLAQGPVLAMVWEGPEAVKIGRKLVGGTIPAKAEPGTIRGDFSVDNVELANRHGRPFYNLIHASGEVAEAELEIELWFGGDELFKYDTNSTKIMGQQGKVLKNN